MKLVLVDYIIIVIRFEGNETLVGGMKMQWADGVH